MIKLKEQMIGTIIDNIKVSMQIQKTKHAGQRQSRHDDNFISDDDIKVGLEHAVKAIAKELMLDEIDIDDFVCVTNSSFNPPLNIIGAIKEKNEQLQFIVITIMKKYNFKPKPGTYHMRIK